MSNVDEDYCFTDHATVQVLVHFAECVRWSLAFAGHNDADVCHSERVLRLDGRGSTKRDEDAL